MSATAETVIIGGGVMGCSIAYNLAAGGTTDVLMLEGISESIRHIDTGFAVPYAFNVNYEHLITIEPGKRGGKQAKECQLCSGAVPIDFTFTAMKGESRPTSTFSGSGFLPSSGWNPSRWLARDASALMSCGLYRESLTITKRSSWRLGMSMQPVDLYPLADEVSFTEDDMVVSLVDGRTVSVPLVWFPRLATATSEQRKNYELLGDGEGIHWPDIDEDLSVEGLLKGTH